MLLRTVKPFQNFMIQECSILFGRNSLKIDPLHESTHFMLTHVEIAKTKETFL